MKTIIYDPDGKKYLASDIEWDTDGEEVDGLPTDVTIVFDPDANDCIDQDEINEKLVDILSDEYGWLIDFCHIEEAEE